ncbi:hypothetical protein CC86DRAFT_19582 [Ophiobolus disseminans]|uniref:Uncharacterized protein n=1 Tax=Ophiobolus disseminans TaxID=1469910 RepID=A0A6A7A025_9PLEO|nr:hypothetical protein CC86DRAFT_19582 [Ophiobolus disseminans]
MPLDCSSVRLDGSRISKAADREAHSDTSSNLAAPLFPSPVILILPVITEVVLCEFLNDEMPSGALRSVFSKTDIRRGTRTWRTDREVALQLGPTLAVQLNVHHLEHTWHSPGRTLSDGLRPTIAATTHKLPRSNVLAITCTRNLGRLPSLSTVLGGRRETFQGPREFHTNQRCSIGRLSAISL